MMLGMTGPELLGQASFPLSTIRQGYRYTGLESLLIQTPSRTRFAQESAFYISGLDPFKKKPQERIPEQRVQRVGLWSPFPPDPRREAKGQQGRRDEDSPQERHRVHCQEQRSARKVSEIRPINLKPIQTRTVLRWATLSRP